MSEGAGAGNATHESQVASSKYSLIWG
jgi:hypothetical protein